MYPARHREPLCDDRFEVVKVGYDTSPISPFYLLVRRETKREWVGCDGSSIGGIRGGGKRILRGKERKIGWGGRIRTFTILINSEVSYRLDHAPAASSTALQPSEQQPPWPCTRVGSAACGATKGLSKITRPKRWTMVSAKSSQLCAGQKHLNQGEAGPIWDSRIRF